MTNGNFKDFNDELRKLSPLVLCLTNFVTVTDVANALLAIGASPVMGDDPSDVQALASIASALVLNIGTINDRRQDIMMSAAKVARERKMPIVFDPVGAGASQRRLAACRNIIDAKPTIIRGNSSEILALCGNAGIQKGVDASDIINIEILSSKASELSIATGAIVAVTGPTDIATDGKTLLAIEGGTPLLTSLTGTGCLLTAMIAAYAGATPDKPLLATAAALTHLARAGEKALTGLPHPRALGTYKAQLFDQLAILAGSEIE
ncbi:MAG: hydroxyethylthiazole kinase [Deltaproteobacteria bacterium]|jgi:hydroxyethylthiazole kinase|nr:hydroxyethylthiazole kinase [Deltaproteobacteria bacterium]